MNINPYSSYFSLNTHTTASTNTTDISKNAKSTETTIKSKNKDSVTLSNINASEYLKKYPNLNYNVLNAAESFPDWYQNGTDNGFPLQDLFINGVTETSSDSCDINTVPENNHAVFIPPALQEKMDNNPELTIQVIRKTEDFIQSQQMLKDVPGLTSIGMNITNTSSVLSFDENGEIATWNIIVDYEIETPENLSAVEITTETSAAQMEVTDDTGNTITYKSVATRISISASRYEGIVQLEEQLVITFDGDMIDLSTGKLVQASAKNN